MIRCPETVHCPACTLAKRCSLEEGHTGPHSRALHGGKHPHDSTSPATPASSSSSPAVFALNEAERAVYALNEAEQQVFAAARVAAANAPPSQQVYALADAILEYDRAHHTATNHGFSGPPKGLG